MITTNDWKQYFPFEEIRPQQEESINFVLNSFDSGKRVVILEAPVGSGKSGIAITLAEYYKNNKNPQIPLKSTWLLTTQKVLQEQYIKEFNNVASISSKSNYKCAHRIGLSCELGKWLDKFSKNKCKCIYDMHKEAFKNSEISLTNTQYFLNHYEYAKDEIDHRKLLIVDEAHNLESNITEFISINFNQTELNEHNISWCTDKTETIKWIKSEVLYKLNKIKEKMQMDLDKLKLKKSNVQSEHDIAKIKKFNDLDIYICKINRCIDRYNPSDWVINNTINDITLKPIYASQFTNEQLFNCADKILLMSGTIDKKLCCKTNGISESECDFLSLTSEFPVENRPILISATGFMSKDKIDATLPTMAEKIKEILELHKNDKGIIFTHTYKISNYLMQSNDPRLITHTAKNRINILENFMTNQDNKVMITPSLTEGISLDGDISRFQIICKMPFPFIGDEYIKEKMNRIKDWYSYETVKTIIQMSGRSIRSKDDYAVTYILDSSWNYFYRMNKQFFPKWWTSAIIKM